MSFETDILEPAVTPLSASRAGMGLHPLQQAAVRLGDYRDGRARVRAKDLVGLLLCHGARAWRAAQPAADVTLRVSTSGSGQRAVRLSLRGERS